MSFLRHKGFKKYQGVSVTLLDIFVSHQDNPW